MKKMLVILTIFFFTAGCSEEEATRSEEEATPQLNTTSIYGIWQLVGGGGYTIEVNRWIDYTVENGYTITFKNTNMYSSTEPTACKNDINTGSFSLDKIESSDPDPNNYNLINLTISIDCPSRGDAFIRTFFYTFENNYLVLDPRSHACDEGCIFRFKKIADEVGKTED